MSGAELIDAALELMLSGRAADGGFEGNQNGSFNKSISGIPPIEKPMVSPADKVAAGIPAATKKVVTQTQPSGTSSSPADYRKAWRVGLGWMGGHNPPPTIDDLLPLEMWEKLLQVWLATGTNVLYAQAQSILNTIGEGGPEAVALVSGSLEIDLFARVDDLSAKWEGGSAE